MGFTPRCGGEEIAGVCVVDGALVMTKPRPDTKREITENDQETGYPDFTAFIRDAAEVKERHKHFSTGERFAINDSRFTKDPGDHSKECGHWVVEVLGGRTTLRWVMLSFKTTLHARTVVPESEVFDVDSAYTSGQRL